MFYKEINEFCNKIGSNKLLVQGAGGNISIKSDNCLHIKASGKWLEEAKKKNIFFKINLPQLLEKIKTQDYVLPSFKKDKSLKPSIETMFHAIIPHKFVLHLHPIVPLSHLVKKDTENLLKKKIKAEFDYIFLNYKKPGEELAQEIDKYKYNYKDVSVIFLQNHGIIISAENLDLIDNYLENINIILSQNEKVYGYKNFNPKVNQSLVEKNYNLINSNKIQQLISPEFFFHLNNNWAIYPDHVVFLGAKPFIINNNKELNKFLEAKNKPDLVFFKDKGVYHKGKVSETTLVQLECFFDVIVRQEPGTYLNLLNPYDIEQLINWDAEKFRINNAK